MKLLTFANQQNVNADVMNIFYNTKDDNLTGYFEIAPCICFGVGNFNTTQFGQIGTTNAIVLTAGYLRFADQVTPVSNGAIQKIFTPFTGGPFNITVPTSATTYYVCAALTMTIASSHVANATAALNTTAKLVGAIDPLSDVVLFAIEENAGVYSITIDSNCSKNYGAPITEMYIANRPVAGNVPYSTVSVFLQGDYTHAQLNATNGVSNNYANTQTTYVDGGNGIFKPYVESSVSDPAGYAASFSAQAAGAGNAYEGFDCNIYNQIDSTNYAVLEMYPVSGNPSSDWQLTRSSTLNTGLALSINDRPTVLGNLSTLAKPTNAVVVMNDFAGSLGVGALANGYHYMPDLTIDQWVFQTIATNTLVAINFPHAFTTGCFNIVASFTNLNGLPTANRYTVSAIPISLTQFQVYILSNVGGTLGCCFRMIGK